MPAPVGFDDDAQWIAHRLERILGDEAARTVIEQKGMQ
jgi:hypothetical protein